MYYMYIDKKGPQERFKISKPYDRINKISYGNDNMHTYVANIILINEKNLNQIENEYKILENEYLNTRPQLKKNLKIKNKELKGKDIIKNENFKYGIASLKTNEIQFFIKLLTLLEKFKVENFVFSISKIALILDSRLNNWILDVSEKYEVSCTLLHYSLAKFLDIECSQKTLEKFLDKKINIKEVLLELKNNLSDIITYNVNNKRMKRQINIYMEIVTLIEKTIEIDVLEPNIEAKFNWNKFRFMLELWLNEGKEKKFLSEMTIFFLDEGIPKSPFEKIGLNLIEENCKSDEHIGLMITDVLVVLIGKYISKLGQNAMYDLDNPDVKKLLDKEWFELNEEQFCLIKLISKYFFKNNRKFSYCRDTYFDDSLVFETFIKYISEFENIEKYNFKSGEEHSFCFLLSYIRIADNIFQEFLDNELKCKEVYGSYREAIDKKGIRLL